MGKKISQMDPAPATTDGEEYFEVVQGGVSYKIQLKNMGYGFQGVYIPNGVMVMGNYPPEHFYWYGAYPNNSYLTLDKQTEDNDASLVFTQGGRAKWEFGATTETAPDSPRIHMKRVLNPTGDGADDVFQDVWIWDYDTGDAWIPRPYRFGIGNLPTERFHVSDNPDDARVISKFENYNGAAGSQSAVIQFQGGTNSWVMGNDYGMNGGDNFFVQGGAGLKMFVDQYGVAFGGGSTLASTEAFRVDSTTQGMLPPRLTTIQRDAMGGKNTALTIWNSDLNKLQHWIAPAAEWYSTVTRGFVEQMEPVLEESIVWWGDSLTFGSGGTPPTTAFDDLVGPGSSYNQGVGGETSTQIKDRFLAASPSTLEGIQIIWAGRNNYGSPTTVKADIAAMIAAMSHPRYLVLGIINEDVALEQNTGANYSIITTLNSDLATLYGRKFIDIRSILIDHGLDMAGLTPTAADTTDIGLDVIPESLRSDTLHLNTAGYAVVANVVKSRLSRAGDDLANGGSIVGDLDVDGNITATGSVVGGSATRTESANPAYQYRTETGVRRWRFQYQATDAADGSFAFQKWTGAAYSTKMSIDTNDMLNVQGGIKIAGSGSFSQGAMYKDATLGLVMAPIAGATFDWLLTDAAGGSAISLATGTKNVTFWGNILAAEDVDVIGDLSIPQGQITSGTYTPTLTNVANISSSSAYATTYQRVGDVVTVSGRVDFDPTATGAVTRLGITLPVASNLTVEYQLAGTAVSPTNTENACAAILGDIVNDRAQLEFIGPVSDVTNRKWFFTFQYRVN